MSELRTLADGLGFPESPRWHDGRIWCANWGAGEVLALGEDGTREVVARLPAETLPFSIDWLPDGRLLIVDGPRRRLLVQGAAAPGSALDLFAELPGDGSAPFNELVVSAAGVVYVNGGDGIVRVTAEGAAPVAGGLQWPNGMALLDGDRTLVVADSHARKLHAYDTAPDGALTGRRTWAELEHAPDGICADADGAIWVASVPGRCCQRVAEGGQVLGSVAIDCGCFACMLGGPDGRTLFIAAAQWRGMEVAMREGPGTTGRLVAAPGQPAAHAGRP